MFKHRIAPAFTPNEIKRKRNPKSHINKKNQESNNKQNQINKHKENNNH